MLAVLMSNVFRTESTSAIRHEWLPPRHFAQGWDQNHSRCGCK